MNGQATRYVWSLNLFVCFAFLPQILLFFRLVQLETITPRCPCILVSSSPSYIRVVRQL